MVSFSEKLENSFRRGLILVTFLFLQVSLAGADSIVKDSKQADYLSTVGDYEITYPKRVSSDGQFLTNHLHPKARISKRSADNDESDNNGDTTLYYEIHVKESPVHLKLRCNENFLSRSLVVERRKNQFKNITDSRFKKYQGDKCHFHGHVNGSRNTRVAVSTCNGLHGFVDVDGELYFIEPVKGHNLSSFSPAPHVIYRRSALSDQIHISGDTKIHSRSTCGVQDDEREFRQREVRETRELENRKYYKSRRKRSISTEKHVETMVVVDAEMYSYYENEDIETYVLTIMNMVSTIFHDASIGNAVNIVMVRLVIMEAKQDDLVITYHADKTLRSFCKWQKRNNMEGDEHPNHHDVAILLTRRNICSRMNEPCGTLGLSQVAGMCEPRRSCNINEDNGLDLAFTIAHELGHNFGMRHNNPSRNGCESESDEVRYVMSPHTTTKSSPFMWSNCSKKSITNFFDRDWGYCLDDEPGALDFEYPVVPPGTMYDADHQCRLQYGQESEACDGIEENVCSTLWCRVDNKCSTKLHAAAEGTICDHNKWCYEGNCVIIGDGPESINGEWGVWSGWSECSRTCSGGISNSERLCNNPPPSHGGKYCIGERKRYRVCKTEDCEDESHTFRDVQCSEFNNVEIRNKLYEWEAIQTQNTPPCQLHCKPKNQFFSLMLKDTVSDGTRCYKGLSRNMCIGGKCRHIGCDWKIDSAAVEDRCGVCHGDGSTCKTVKEQYNETQGLGYVEATVIPKGARNIRVEEVAAANNYLALSNGKGEYYLNGHWFIQWSGDYDIAGTTVVYKRNDNKETFEAPGPLGEPLHIMLLLQTENPGVIFEYTVPKPNSTEKRLPDFSWIHMDWTHCTASCGGGTQRSPVVCKEVEAGIVEDMYCNITTKPDDKMRSCNEHICPARWWAGPWQHCSVTCGNGYRQRTVICVRSMGLQEQIALEDDICDGQVKPSLTKHCSKDLACPGESLWAKGEWSDCNKNPCGTQTRPVYCKDPVIGCDEAFKPKSIKHCSNTNCGYWVHAEWSNCSRPCGEGVRYRKVSCEGGDKCNLDIEPPSEQKCALPKCPSDVLNTTQSSNVNNVSNVDRTIPGAGSTSTVSPQTTTVKASSNVVSTEVHGSTAETKISSVAGGLSENDKKVSEDFKSEDVQDREKMHKAEEEQKETGVTDKQENKTVQSPNITEGEEEKIEKNIEISPQNENNTDQNHKNVQNDIQNEKSAPLNENTPDIGEDNSQESLGLSPSKILMNHNTSSGSIKLSGSDNANVVIGDNSQPDILHTSNAEASPDSHVQDESSSTEKRGSIQKDESYKSLPGHRQEFGWVASDWGKCSAVCGGGIRRRIVECKHLKSGDNISEDYCRDKKMKEKESCNGTQCLEWAVSGWEHCSVTCGDGFQYRHVHCPEKHRCLKSSRPTKRRICHQPCIAWIEGEWSQCTKSCDGGQQIRNVHCVNVLTQEASNACDVNHRPRTRRECNKNACQEENAAFSTTCVKNDIRLKICHMLKAMNQCDKTFVKQKCCRTCSQHNKKKKHRPRRKQS